jgi:hypothetical protein
MSSSALSSKLNLCTAAQISVLQLLERHRCSVFISVIDEYLNCLAGEFDVKLLFMVMKLCAYKYSQNGVIENFIIKQLLEQIYYDIMENPRECMYAAIIFQFVDWKCCSENVFLYDALF